MSHVSPRKTFTKDVQDCTPVDEDLLVAFDAARPTTADDNVAPGRSRSSRGLKAKSAPLLHRGRLLPSLSVPRRVHWILLVVGLALLLLSAPAFAAGVSAPGSALSGLIELAGGSTGQPLSLSLQLLLLMTLLALLPSVLLMMTAFVRVIVVLSILRQAIGLQQAPPNQLLVGLSLFLTFFVMQPVLDRINREALQPFVSDTIPAEQAVGRAGDMLHGFMMANTRTQDLNMFARIAGEGPFASAEDVPMRVLMPAFATSELKTAFQIGVLLFLPFLVIDLVVASVLMALGMMMVSPVMIALPFKLMLFVAVDGWALVTASLAQSFAAG